jgi:hypothetical protein
MHIFVGSYFMGSYRLRNLLELKSARRITFASLRRVRLKNFHCPDLGSSSVGVSKAEMVVAFCAEIVPVVRCENNSVLDQTSCRLSIDSDDEINGIFHGLPNYSIWLEKRKKCRCRE